MGAWAPLSRSRGRDRRGLGSPCSLHRVPWVMQICLIGDREVWKVKELYQAMMGICCGCAPKRSLDSSPSLQSHLIKAVDYLRFLLLNQLVAARLVYSDFFSFDRPNSQASSLLSQLVEIPDARTVDHSAEQPAHLLLPGSPYQTRSSYQWTPSWRASYLMRRYRNPCLGSCNRWGCRGPPPLARWQ